MESCDVVFLENEYPRRGEVEREASFFEQNKSEDLVPTPNVDDQDSVPSGSNQVPNEPTPQLDHSGSIAVNDSLMPESSTRRSRRIRVPRRHFEIEGEAFILTSHDGDEPKNVNQALNSPAKKLWIKAMEE